MVRDYADWLWSAYNYWCDEAYDAKCTYASGHWTIPGTHIRTPEQFQKFLNAEIIQKTIIPSPKIMNNACQIANNMFQSQLQSIWNTVPVEDTLILASEELETNPEKTWARIATA